MIDWEKRKAQHFLTWSEDWEKMNQLGTDGESFFFLIDFNAENVHVWPVDEIPPEVHVSFPAFKTSKIPELEKTQEELFLLKDRVPMSQYKEAFDQIIENIHKGNTYLLNLCFKNSIQLQRGLADIFVTAHAPYKVLWEDKFTFFSPEKFVTIDENTISTFPMKGTSESDSEKSKKQLFNNRKERAEHFTVVDLLRNDIGQFSHNVRVEDFRYLEKINTHIKGFWQASSHIAGGLQEDWKNHIGDILFLLLPAGSITGAPKKKTVEIIQETEKMSRNYYTGISGYFDGESLDSAVNIRFVEKENQGYFFKTGGGLTFLSNIENEYEELFRKIQVPLS